MSPLRLSSFRAFTEQHRCAVLFVPPTNAATSKPLRGNRRGRKREVNLTQTPAICSLQPSASRKMENSFRMQVETPPRQPPDTAEQGPTPPPHPPLPAPVCRCSTSGQNKLSVLAELGGLPLRFVDPLLLLGCCLASWLLLGGSAAKLVWMCWLFGCVETLSSMRQSVVLDGARWDGVLTTVVAAEMRGSFVRIGGF